MSKSIKEAISVETFLDVEHLGGAAAIVIADDSWFQGRRHANQAFQVMNFGKTKISHHHFCHSKIQKKRSNSLSFPTTQAKVFKIE